MEHQRPPCANLDQVLTKIGTGYFHSRLLLISGLGFSAAGVEVVIVAFLLPELRRQWGLTEYQLGLFASTTGVASVVGQLVWGAFADRFGRRLCFMITVLFVAVFGTLTSMSQGLVSLICFRAGCSFGIGGNISVDFTMFTEFLATQDRGRMLFRMQVFWPVGQLVACLIARYVIPFSGWRVFLAVCVVPAVVTALFRPLIPESPRWLLLQGRDEDAIEVCRHMAILNGVSPDDVGLGTGATLSLAGNESTPLAQAPGSQSKGNPLALAAKLFSPSLLYTTLGICTFSIVLHTVGFGALTYMPSMLQFKGINRLDYMNFMIIGTLCEIPGVITIALSHWMGRLMPMKLGFIGASVCFLMFAAAQTFPIIITSVCFLMFFVEGSWALFHVYVPEIYPTEIRATAVALLTSAGSLGAFFTPFIATYVQAHNGLASVCSFFAICGMLGSVAAFLFLHIETCDRDLDDRASKRIQTEKEVRVLKGK